ncbi:MAG: IS66 family transposase [Candidatus Obscuribacterales bacterium]|nr:IS66 family transposase [Candidatus Obscuribacterales bacterium]
MPEFSLAIEKVESGKTEATLILAQTFALPKSALGKVVTYALNNWAALNTCIEDGALTIDNNLLERALGSMAVGRKIGYSRKAPLVVARS